MLTITAMRIDRAYGTVPMKPCLCVGAERARLQPAARGAVNRLAIRSTSHLLAESIGRAEFWGGVLGCELGVRAWACRASGMPTENRQKVATSLNLSRQLESEGRPHRSEERR